MFIGKLPWVPDGSMGQQWRVKVNNVKHNEAKYRVPGRTIKHGFSRLGLPPLGSAGVMWFAPDVPTTAALLDGFEGFFFSSPFIDLQGGAPKQVDWMIRAVQEQARPCFVFLNLAETHSPYFSAAHGLRAEITDRDADACRQAQKASLCFCDQQLAKLFEGLRQVAPCEGVICADHGDCWGEDGYWGHGIVHEKVLDVPYVKVG